MPEAFSKQLLANTCNLKVSYESEARAKGKIKRIWLALTRKLEVFYNLKPDNILLANSSAIIAPRSSAATTPSLSTASHLQFLSSRDTQVK